MLSAECLATVKSHYQFSPLGETTGNLTLGRGRASAGAGKPQVPVFVAIVENRIASGSLGVKECDKLASLFKVVAAQKAGMVIYLDSAGARVSEGLPALGAFRMMYRTALDAAASGASITVYCGTNCFGGASMLAALATARVYSENTRFAMSGPSILAQAAGISALDDIFMAMSMVAIGGGARSKLDVSESLAGVTTFTHLPVPRVDALFARHGSLGERLAGTKIAANTGVVAKVERKDLAKLYPEGYQLNERAGVLSGEATYEGQPVLLAGFVGGKMLGAERAWAQADALWKLTTEDSAKRDPARRLHLLIDCESHATSIEDERMMLSAYLADLASALHAVAASGFSIETIVLGKLGGGVYVAVCAPVSKVTMLYGAEIQLLPGRAIASILGETAMQKHGFAEYASARVAERELKLGIV
ncbi:MAG: biotin-independent malonate decarboxylase subunit gamma [Usitatibacteraceae bacterium]